MITGMTVSGFRTFAELRIDQLTRVNLFVGTNNAGKTSILEAAELVAVGAPVGLRRSLLRRVEEVLVSQEERGPVSRSELDPSHLFHGHALSSGKSFSITAEGEIRRRVKCEIFEAGPDMEKEWFIQQRLLDIEQAASVLALRFESHLMPEGRIIPLTPYGSLPDFRRFPIYSAPEPSPLVNFLGTETITALRLGQLWDAVVLTPEEEGVVDALRLIEPRIERIAFLGESRTSRSVFLKLSDSEQRLPLGSVGDGLKRLLALTLHLFSARGGFLLVDEIDTGLHYSVMADMWRLVIETARRLDVQVLATTHSLDCVRALAWVREQSPDATGDVTLHRIEKDARETVAYDLDELAIAARDHIEVR